MVTLTKEEQKKIADEHELRVKKEALRRMHSAVQEMAQGMLHLVEESATSAFVEAGVIELYASLCEIKAATENLLPAKWNDHPKTAA